MVTECEASSKALGTREMEVKNEIESKWKEAGQRSRNLLSSRAVEDVVRENQAGLFMLQGWTSLYSNKSRDSKTMAKFCWTGILCFIYEFNDVKRQNTTSLENEEKAVDPGHHRILEEWLRDVGGCAWCHSLHLNSLA